MRTGPERFPGPHRLSDRSRLAPGAVACASDAGTEPLAQLIAIADTDKVARLRLLRALRDLDTPKLLRSKRQA